MILKLLVFAFLNLTFHVCCSQNDIKKMESEINAEIESKMESIKEKASAPIMNPFTKKIYAEFAVDTFKIEYFKRKIIKKLNSKEALELIQKNTQRYEELVSKYYELSKKECNESEKAQLIASQAAWENFKNEEFAWLKKRLQDSPLDTNYYGQYCKIMKQRLLHLFFYYSDLKEN